MNKRSFLLLFACVTSLSAQNLIPNGGFEEYHKLPDNDGAFNGYIKSWSNLNGKSGYPNGTPDFLHTNGSQNGAVGKYYYSEVKPYAGDGMMGVIVMPGTPFYEYVCADVPVKKGRRYEFSMYINNGVPDYCGCSAKGFGVYFSDKLPQQSVSERVEANPQWQITQNFHTEKWERIRFQFTAPEDYSFLTLGYFADPDALNLKFLNKGGDNDCIYFFIDEISLVEVNGGSGVTNLDLPAGITQVETAFATVNATPQPPVMKAVVRVQDRNTLQALPASVSVVNLSDNSEVMNFPLDASKPEMTLTLGDPKVNYGIFAKSKGYVDGSEKIEPLKLVRDTTLTRTVLLSPIKKGERIVLKNIYFDTGKYELLPASFPELDKLTQFLLDNPEVRVELSGHTDSQGADAMNMELSNNRAKAVYTYLLKQIDKGRMEYKGYGENNPVSTNDTPEGRQLNRRVEFKIL